MIQRRSAGSLAIAAVLLLATVASAQTDQVVVIDQTVEPMLLEVEPGTTVTWENRDDERHRVRSKEGPVRFDSKNLGPGETYQFTFTTPGSYPYYDHRNRDDAEYFGTIVVGAAADVGAPHEAGAVSVVDRSFQPPALRLIAGGTVTWTNDDGEAHTVTSTEDAFDSGIVSAGGTYDRVFEQPGDHPYFCLIHPEMRGIVTVVDPADLPADPIALTEPDPVAIEGFAFQPDAIEVSAGQTVLWANVDPVGHTVTAVDGTFDSGVLTVDTEFSNTFETPGTFDYFCAIHPSMTGSVVVSE